MSIFSFNNVSITTINFLGIVLGIVMAFIREYIHKNGEEDQENMYKVKSLVLQNVTDLMPFKRTEEKKRLS